MIVKELKKNILFATFAIPLSDSKLWTELSFNKIKPNVVQYTTNGIQIEVKESASPLIYKLDQVTSVNGFRLKLKKTGELMSRSEGFPEDFAFRFGLVVKGDQRLTGFKKLAAASWVKKLFSLAPEGVGLDKIYFYSIAESEKSVGLKRDHPKTELMIEEVIGFFNKGLLSLEKKFDKPKDVVAIWISIDGDDSKSAYKISIEEMTLNL